MPLGLLTYHRGLLLDPNQQTWRLGARPMPGAPSPTATRPMPDQGSRQTRSAQRERSYDGQRLAIAARAYAVVVLFGLGVLALRHFASSLSQTEILILSGLLAAPLVLALFWEHLKGFKVVSPRRPSGPRSNIGPRPIRIKMTESGT